MKKDNSNKYFVVTLPLITQKWQEDIIDKRLEVARNIYNALLNVTKKKYKEMVKTKHYRGLISSLTGDKKTDAPIWKEIKQIRIDNGFSQYGFNHWVIPMQHHFKGAVGSREARCVANNLWVAYDKLFYGNNKSIEHIKFKRKGELNSLRGSEPLKGLYFDRGLFKWNGLVIPVKLKVRDSYLQKAFQHDIAYSGILRKFIRGKYKYYIQITFKGVSPLKDELNLGTGDVGLDIGISTIAISSEKEVKLLELADKVQDIEKEKRVLLRKMDRSMKANNPNNYNDDGTIIKGTKFKKSKRYLKTQLQLKELYRKQAAIRKYQHECLSKYIISLGDKIYVEDMNFKALQARAKNTAKTSTGKYKSKKRFGKAIENRAPATLLAMVDRKLKYFDKELIKIDTQSAKASQYNHTNQSYTKKKLSQRWFTVGNNKIQRDLYSAFLIMNINEDLTAFNGTKCNERFNRFLELHNQEIERLKSLNKKHPCSMGV